MKERIRLLLIKLVSVKGVLFIIGTILMFMGKITPEIWCLISLLFASIRTVEKFIRAVWPGGKP
jgi:hypothetical protein